MSGRKLNELLLSLASVFGQSRFTAADYWVHVVGRPRSASAKSDNTEDQLDQLVEQGLVLAAPGPRGGKGYRLPAKVAEKALRQLATKNRIEERRNDAARRHNQMAEEKRVRAAISLLRSHGYTVTKMSIPRSCDP